MIPLHERKQFQKKVLTRYEANKRVLPWRETTDPYQIMVSEFMLQQTQVSRVIPKFLDWMHRRPTVGDLAKASRADVLRSRSGLGFNRRAINLHEAAKQIDRPVSLYNDKQSSQYNSAHKGRTSRPVSEEMSDYAFLRSLPGVGEYTANAILAFAYNYPVAVIDINIKRVLIHSFDLPPDISLFDLQTIALSLIPDGESRTWHNALMDYGSMVLHSKATGIQSAKQSKFQGSKRQVRGWILKQLVALKRIPLQDVAKQWPDHETESIVADLCKEGYVTLKKGMIGLVK